MTELETLQRRRKLVVLSADVQRATVMHRIDQLNVGPLRMLYEVGTNVTRFIALRRIALGIFAIATRFIGRRAGRA